MDACGPRQSADDAFCQKSDESKFGNCFCGPLDHAPTPSSRLGLRGINYGGRFIPEEWMHLDGMRTLYADAKSGCADAACQLSTCDLAATGPGAGKRMLGYLEASIREDDFAKMAAGGFNVVRLPLGYWQLVNTTGAPDAPPATATRWKALQDMLPPAAYTPYIERVLSFAAKHRLKVLLDLHGAPGGQSTNQCTGCATDKGGVYFVREANVAIALEAIRTLAQMCVRAGDTCYGVELLNEPGLAIDRQDLLAFYQKAVHAARTAGGLPATTPIVVMDWPIQLDTFWAQYKSSLGALMPKQQAGSVQFETHIYVPANYGSIALLEVQAVPMLLPLRRFAASAGAADYPTFIGEWSLSRAESDLDKSEVAKWWYRAASVSAHGLGLAAWSFDGPGGWGALVPVNGSLRTWWKAVNRWPH